MEVCSVIIAAYNEAENLKKCLRSLTKTDYPAEYLEIIVIDNNSTDRTAEIIRRYPEVVYACEKKQGASFARNKGIALAKRGNILVFLDADTEVATNWLTSLLEPFEDETIGAVGGAIYPNRAGNIFSEYLGVSLFLRYPRYGKKRYMKGFPSCNLAIRKSLIVDGFDTDTFSYYGEDKDICYQVLDKNYKVLFQPEAIVYHRHPETTRELLDLFINSSRGRVNFAKKYPFAPDIIVLNYHAPLIYSTILFISLNIGKGEYFLPLLSPALLYLGYSAVIAYQESKKTLLSFLIKPFFDMLSVYAIYVLYWYFKISKRVGAASGGGS